ncbi:MAG TPA: hydroxyacylglutathione hydrolase [Gammaproteobacteria bacterium]|nr:hydroxyacylglutathione hydrolase [Gammaproteobacteria bacterium]
MQAIALPAFKDNYIWLLPGPDGTALVVDPGDAAPVLATLHTRHLALGAILVTHHHYDHVNGIEPLLDRFPVPVYGPATLALCDHPVAEGSSISPLPGLTLQVMETPGHTLDHLCYHGHGILFCGDTLFAGGCGRLFEGTAAQLYASLERLRALPDETLVHCAHEYTLSNLEFAARVEPDNAALMQRLEEVRAQRRRHEPTLPSSLGLEKRTNPFLRCHLPTVQAAASAFRGHELDSPEAVFAVIRYWKDTF